MCKDVKGGSDYNHFMYWHNLVVNLVKYISVIDYILYKAKFVVCIQQQTEMYLTFGVFADVSPLESFWNKDTGKSLDFLANLLPQPLVHIWAVTDSLWPALTGINLHRGTETSVKTHIWRCNAAVITAHNKLLLLLTKYYSYFLYFYSYSSLIAEKLYFTGSVFFR